MEINSELLEMINKLKSPDKEIILDLIIEIEKGRKDKNTLRNDLRYVVREYVSKEMAK